MDQLFITSFKVLKIGLEPGLIKLYSNSALWTYLKGKDPDRLLFLIDEIKRRYEEKYQKPLHIGDSSLLVEILIHVYCHNVGLCILPFVKINFFRTVLEKLIERASIVDCGEFKSDTNRWFWDLLGPFKTIVVGAFPNELKMISYAKPTG
ncbi:hypothetical protein ACVWYG_000323 [Pedobacter sp. UYEF25]